MKKILITILLILISAVSLVAYYHRDNITAMINGTKYSSEELETQLDESKDKLKEEVKKYSSASADIQDISAEDEKKLLRGEISLQEIAEKYNLPHNVITGGINTSSSTNSTSDAGSDKTNSPSKKPSSDDVDQSIAEAVSQMYALKALYVSKLGELERKVVSDYKSLPAEKQNESAKKEIVMKNIDYVAQIEKNCDYEVAYVLNNLKSELEEYNNDIEIVSILRNAYDEEKEIKKSYYLSLYYN